MLLLWQVIPSRLEEESPGEEAIPSLFPMDRSRQLLQAEVQGDESYLS